MKGIWISTGVLASDATTGKQGSVQLLQDSAGAVSTRGIHDPARVLLRPVDQDDGEPWWTAAEDLRVIREGGEA